MWVFTFLKIYSIVQLHRKWSMNSELFSLLWEMACDTRVNKIWNSNVNFFLSFLWLKIFYSTSKTWVNNNSASFCLRQKNTVSLTYLKWIWFTFIHVALHLHYSSENPQCCIERTRPFQNRKIWRCRDCLKQVAVRLQFSVQVHLNQSSSYYQETANQRELKDVADAFWLQWHADCWLGKSAVS